MIGGLGSIVAVGTAAMLTRGRGDSWGVVVPSAGAGYILGSALGVHIVAGRYNRHTSYAGTVISGAIGMGTAAVVLAAKRGRIGPEGITFLILPIVCEVLFVNLADQSAPPVTQAGRAVVPMPAAGLPLVIHEQQSIKALVLTVGL